MADKIATLHLPGKEPVELPILSGTVGPDVIDVRKLGAQGYFTFDPGFMATGACKSSITYIDGDQGVLLHRGYPIAQLATQASYLEVCYILLYGEAPTKTQYAEFERLVTRIQHAIVVAVEFGHRLVTVKGLVTVLQIATLPEQFTSAINGAIVIAVHNQKAVAASDPAGLNGTVNAKDIKLHALCQTAGLNTIAIEIEHDW